MRISGHLEACGTATATTYYIDHKGPIHIEFKDTNQKISYSLPQVLFTGLVWGSYALSMQSSLIFCDHKNRLKAHLTLGDDAQRKAQKTINGCNEKEADMLGRIYKYK